MSNNKSGERSRIYKQQQGGYMDKQQILMDDLSISQPNLITLTPKSYEDYDHLRSFSGSHPAPRQRNLCSDHSGATRAWNSAAPLTTNCSSLAYVQHTKGNVEKDHKSSNAALISEIDRTMKKHVDNLMHALEGVSAKICQLESRSRNLENSVDELKITVENNQGITYGKLRQLENILREVESDVQVIRDKQDIFEAQIQLAKLQIPKVEHQSEPQGHVEHESVASAPLQAHHQQPLPPSPSLPNAPLLAPQQNLPPPIHFPNQYPPNQINPYYPPSSQQQETSTQQNQPPPPLPPQHLPQYQTPPPQYSQLATPQQHPSHHPKDSPYVPPQRYPPSLHQTGHPPNPSSPNFQHFYGPNSNKYDPPSSRYGSGYSRLDESPQYPYGGPPSHGIKQPISSSQILTARVLPQAIPTASGVGDGSGASSGTGNRVPIDDVVDKVTSMGFSRDQVRGTVRKLTENGQSVDLNIVLDKLMNDGVEVQPPKGWFGR